MDKHLCILLCATAASACATTPTQLSADKIMGLAKVELRSCCKIDSKNYDLSILKDVDGDWTVSAIPKQVLSSSPDVVVAQGGGDIHLFYDRFGTLKGEYRGQ